LSSFFKAYPSKYERGCGADLQYSMGLPINVFVERVWKSIRYEEVCLHAYETVQGARNSIGEYLEF
jgi:hypothetical protein